MNQFQIRINLSKIYYVRSGHPASFGPYPKDHRALEGIVWISRKLVLLSSVKQISVFVREILPGTFTPHSQMSASYACSLSSFIVLCVYKWKFKEHYIYSTEHSKGDIIPDEEREAQSSEIVVLLWWTQVNIFILLSIIQLFINLISYQASKSLKSDIF